VVLDLFHFDDPVAQPLRVALETGCIACAASPATLAEWQRVLAYPRFALTADRQAQCYANYAALAEPHADSETRRTPRCSDADDQKFIDLAWHCGAAVLVSKDLAVLALGRQCPGFAILTPAAAVTRLPP
jgi:predicted nucleic acid-binding protein